MMTRLTTFVCGVAAMLLAVSTATAQGFFARGDATCNLGVSAADIVAEVRALGNTSVCHNDDCDRNGSLGAADTVCVASCLFGTCAVPQAPQVTNVVPDSAPAISPFSAIQITGTNLGSPDRLKQVTIGGINATVVAFDAPDTLTVVVPGGVPPGPTDIVVFDGDVAGPASTITIAPAAAIGMPDTFEGTLDLLDTAVGLLLALNLDTTLETDTAVLRQSLETLRTNLATQRAALAADPEVTAAVRARLDAALESSGAPEMLRQLISDLEDVLVPAPALRWRPFIPTGVVAFANGARTVQLVGAVVTAATAPISVPAAAGIALVLGIATGIMIHFASGMPAAPMVPLILSVAFLDANRNPVIRPLPGGVAKVVANNLDFEDARLVIVEGRGSVTIPVQQAIGDNTFFFPLPDPDPGDFCGNVQFSVFNATARVGSPSFYGQVQPVLQDIAPSPQGYIGTRLKLRTRGALGCPDQAVAVFKNIDTNARSSAPLTGGDRLQLPIPDIEPATYLVTASVAGVESKNTYALQIDDLLAPNISCEKTKLALPPTDPAVPPMDPILTVCHAAPNPHDVPFPEGTIMKWNNSDPSVASITVFSTASYEPPFGTRIKGLSPGTAMLTATYMHKNTMETTANGITITVVDESPPQLTLTSSPGAGKVNPGDVIQVTAKAHDNYALRSIDAMASGDAVEGETSQSFTCPLTDPDCDADFSFTLKKTDFTSSQVTITVTATDRTSLTAKPDPLTFTLKKDTTCPDLTITSPGDGTTVNAGSSVQVAAMATDNQEDDTGVKSFIYTATGDALVTPVSQTLNFPMALPTAMLHFGFMVKKAEDLANVMNKSITVSVDAVDDAKNTCGVKEIFLNVGGILDHCEGAINADNPADCDGKQVTITVVLSGDAATKVTKVTSINPGGQYDLAPQGNGVYSVTLTYGGTGSFTLSFTAFDADGTALCGGSIGLQATGPCPEPGAQVGHAAALPPAGAAAGATQSAH